MFDRARETGPDAFSALGFMRVGRAFAARKIGPDVMWKTFDAAGVAATKVCRICNARILSRAKLRKCLRMQQMLPLSTCESRFPYGLNHRVRVARYSSASEFSVGVVRGSSGLEP
jgi:hypothetical protein